MVIILEERFHKHDDNRLWTPRDCQRMPRKSISIMEIKAKSGTLVIAFFVGQLF